jgi:hypothetical protein
MACHWIRMADGTVIHLNLGKTRRSKCAFCSRPHTKLCDMVIGKNLLGEPITCDAKICDMCARQVGVDKDYCPKHQ